MFLGYKERFHNSGLYEIGILGRLVSLVLILVFGLPLFIIAVHIAIFYSIIYWVIKGDFGDLLEGLLDNKFLDYIERILIGFFGKRV